MLDQDTWAKVRVFMQRTCGVVMSDDQRYLLDARVLPLLRPFGYSTVRAYVDHACAANLSDPTATALIDAMTTHETYFFRDQPFWTGFEQVILPKVIAARAGQPLRIWSAACSTGQEPYSLAMLLEERWPEVAARAEIHATDVSAIAIDRARTGSYSTIEVNRGLGAARLLRHFERGVGAFRIQAKLRDRITWRAHNLLGASAGPKDCDIVLCRNVLIYFGDSDRATVLGRLQNAGRPGGYLGVGSTEFLKPGALLPGWHRFDEKIPSNSAPMARPRSAQGDR